MEVFSLVGSLVGALISIAVLVLMLVAQWKILTKAGEKGWKILIPFYGAYIMYKISWKTSWFWFLLVAAIVVGILQAIGGTFCTILAAIFAIFIAVLEIIQLVKLSKAFGHGGGYAVGLIFLPVIFFPIIGLGSSQYVGASE